MTQFTCKGVKQINNRISLNMTFTFTFRISLRFSSAQEFQMGNFQKYWSQNVGQDFIVLDFFHGWKILKVDGRDPQNREKNAPAGRFTCMMLFQPKFNTIFFKFDYHIWSNNILKIKTINKSVQWLLRRSWHKKGPRAHIPDLGNR
jgi:hypothetical protein